jgi:hypothetical protein
MCFSPLGGLAALTQTPEGDFGLVDYITKVRGGLQARRVTHDAVDVRDRSAASAHDVVMVIAYPVFVPGRPGAKVDLAEQANFGERPERFVDRLEGHMTHAFP